MAMKIEIQLAAFLAALACVAPAAAQRATVSNSNGVWTIRGAKNMVALNERNLSVNIRAGGPRGRWFRPPGMTCWSASAGTASG